MSVKQVSGLRLAQVRPSLLGWRDARVPWAPGRCWQQHRCIRGRGEGHYTPEEHCSTGDQVSGGQELRRGLQAMQTGRTLERVGTPLSLHSGGGPADAHVVCLVNSIFISPPTPLLPSPPSRWNSPWHLPPCTPRSISSSS